MSDLGDVTQSASWSAADSFQLAMDVPAIPSSAVVFRSPGVPTAISAGNMYIRADYNHPRWGHLRSIAPHAYALTPDGGATPLAYLTGFVWSGPGFSTFVPNATVEIVSGESAGKGVVTLAANGSFMIEFVRLGLPFTIRASKTGYSTDTQDSSGIADDHLGYPSNTGFQFHIQPMS